MMAISPDRGRPVYRQSTEIAAIANGSQCDTIYDDEEMTEEDVDEDVEEDLEDEEEEEYEDNEDDEGQGEEEEDLTDTSSSVCLEVSRREKQKQSQSRLSPEIQKFIQQMPEITDHFRILSKIGEGTFSSVYKAIDLKYDLYDNSWDANWKERQKWASPPVKQRKENEAKRPNKYVALKRIYVTSSPIRILNELELLHRLKGCDDVVSLITAFRNEDQIVAVLPYFRHVDFREYYRTLSIRDIRFYFLSLFSALNHVHSKDIIHRDIKPSNFLFDIASRRGVLVDFGLAEFQDPSDAERCPCSLPTPNGRQDSSNHSQKLPKSRPLNEGPGYLKHDERPAKRANRAGTRGFRAPEVLFKCQSQTTKIDRFPFFNSVDDIDAMIELTSIFGRANMKICANSHNCTFDATLPTLSDKPMSFLKIVQWATSEMQNPDREQLLAFEFLDLCMELDPRKRISAAEALRHPFLSSAEEDQFLDDEVFLT